MYAFIEGEVCEKLNGSLTLLAGGVGYLLNCSNNTLQAAPSLGEKMRCYTFLSVREDAMELFGFASREEKELFLQLTSVSGIGPKTALGLLGSMSLRDLNLAILLGDVNALSRAPGIGKKTAQRIALELKDKISQASVSAHADEGAPWPPPPSPKRIPLPRPWKRSSPWAIPQRKPAAPSAGSAARRIPRRI